MGSLNVHPKSGMEIACICHVMEMISTSVALDEGSPLATGGFPHKGPVRLGVVMQGANTKFSIKTIFLGISIIKGCEFNLS